jgi:two-component system sensor kinase FixL
MVQRMAFQCSWVGASDRVAALQNLRQWGLGTLWALARLALAEVGARFLRKATPVSFLVMLVLNVPALAAQTRDLKRVLLVYQHERMLPGNAFFDERLRSAMQVGWSEGIEFNNEFVDPVLLPEPEYEQSQRRALLQRYSDQKIDLLIAWGAQPVDFLRKYRMEIFPSVPVISSTDKRLVENQGLGTNATSVPWVLDAAGTLEAAFRLQPETQRVVVVTGAGLKERFLLETTRQSLRGYENKVELTYVTGLPLNELREQLGRLTERTIVFYVGMTQDQAGHTFTATEILEVLQRTSQVPIYGWVDHHVGHGLVGGHVLNLEAMAEAVANVGLRILRGERPEQISVSSTNNAYVFDWRQLRRFGLDERRLPQGSIVLFRELTLWEQSKWHILGAIAVFLFETALIVGLLIQGTKRKRAEQALRQQASLLDLTHDTILVRDTADVITYWNRGAEQMYGWTKEEALGKVSHHLLRTVFPVPLEEIKTELMRQGRWEGELTHTRRDGVLIVVASRQVLQRDGQGHPVYVLEINNDLSQRKQAEEALSKAQAELTHVARVMTMGELAASIAHEINQPLAAVVTNGNACMRWLTRSQPDLEEARDAVQRIIRDGNRASEVIARIRGLLKRTATNKGPLDINEVIQETVALAQNEARRRRVSLQTNLAANLGPVLGDRVQLQQVILNLMMNGIEAMSSVSDGSRQLLIKTQRDDSDQVLISVTDSGIGLDPKQVERLFEAFFTTKTEGMGMGLSISRSIIEAHGGHLWATPNAGPGATFQFTLPISPDAGV